MMESLAKQIAIDAHSAINQKYDGYLPYEFHLRLVHQVARDHITCVPAIDTDKILSACWLHDALEDTLLTYNDILTQLNKVESKGYSTEVMEIVFACTNNKGRNRKERANDAYYEGIRAVPYAPFVKLCDRIANVTYGQLFGGAMLDMYRKENEHFIEQIGGDKRYGQLTKTLRQLVQIPNA